MALRRTLYRLHFWLGWAVAVPLLFWTVSGLWMVARPIEEVRGEALKRPPAPISIPLILHAPLAFGHAIKTLSVESRPTGAVWVVGFADGSARRADVATGRLLPGISRDEAIALARAAYRGGGGIDSISLTTATAPPLDLRRSRPAWGVSFSDGAHVYIDADTGAFLALRTRQWRLYDWMWGLHIMDLQAREDSSHPALLLSAFLSLAGVITGAILLFLRSRRRNGT